jgi:hypothetical protein
MATQQEINDACDAAKLAILERIAKSAPSTSSGAVIANLAEGYAWLDSPSQPHGGSASST